MSRMAGLSAVSMVGLSSVGQTRALARGICELNQRGSKVAIVKQDGQGFDLDMRGKDSWRYALAGSRSVVISGSRKMTMIDELAAELSLDKTVLLGRLFLRDPQEGDR